MDILVTAQPELRTALVLDGANQTGERLLARYAVERVLDGQESRIRLDDDARVALEGVDAVLKEAVSDTSGGEGNGRHVFSDPGGLVEESIRLLAAVPEAEALKHGIDHRRRMAALMLVDMKHRFTDVDIPVDVAITYPAGSEEPTVDSQTDWGNKYEWLHVSGVEPSRPEYNPYLWPDKLARVHIPDDLGFAA